MKSTMDPLPRKMHLCLLLECFDVSWELLAHNKHRHILTECQRLPKQVTDCYNCPSLLHYFYIYYRMDVIMSCEPDDAAVALVTGCDDVDENYGDYAY